MELRHYLAGTKYCNPGHTLGDKPQIVPVASATPGRFVVYHGVNYLDREGQVVTQGTAHELRVFTSYAEAEAAIARHEANLTDVDGPGERPCSCGHDECGAC